MQTKNVLIIGGAGFIGSRLGLEYLSKGYNVTVLDNMSNHVSYAIFDMQHLANLAKKEFVFVYGCVSDLNNNMFIMPPKQYEIIYHLASESRPLEFNTKYASIIKANVQGTLALIEYVKNTQQNARIIFGSTSEVYGENDCVLNESVVPIISPNHQRNVYSISKMLGENILRNNPELDFNIVRFFNVYGPNFRDDDTKVVPMLVKSISENKTFEICGNGKQTRSFTYIDDVIDALFLIHKKGENHKIYNIGSSECLSINDCVQIAKTYKLFNTTHIPKREGEPKIRKTDSREIRFLGWQPKVLFHKGFEKILLEKGII